uniref:Uncharacterized protein n=1 Tax=Macrostomum lignano TaxID=282301 RepID=A0A1I8GTL1_9PLAT
MLVPRSQTTSQIGACSRLRLKLMRLSTSCELTLKKCWIGTPRSQIWMIVLTLYKPAPRSSRPALASSKTSTGGKT